MAGLGQAPKVSQNSRISGLSRIPRILERVGILEIFGILENYKMTKGGTRRRSNNYTRDKCNIFGTKQFFNIL